MLFQELTELSSLLIEMASLIEKSLDDSIKALLERDTELAQKVIEKDKVINGFDVTIDEDCVKLIALKQPVASELRFIITAMKITSDLERIGDICVNICERVIELNQLPQLKPYIDLPKMANVVTSMLNKVITSFVEKDVISACDVIAMDDEVDYYLNNISEELINYMIKDPNTIPRANKISQIAKYLERIADHTVNIAENVVYLVKGKIIRHTEFRKDLC